MENLSLEKKVENLSIQLKELNDKLDFLIKVYNTIQSPIRKYEGNNNNNIGFSPLTED